MQSEEEIFEAAQRQADLTGFQKGTKEYANEVRLAIQNKREYNLKVLQYGMSNNNQAPPQMNQVETHSSSSASRQSLSCTRTNTPNEDQFKARLYEQYTEQFGRNDNVEIRKLKVKKLYFDEVNLIEKSCILENNRRASKSLLLVGETGAGKTTLINAIANTWYGIKYEDNFRIILDQVTQSAESQTKFVKIYVLNTLPGMENDFDLVLIDTPGLGDTSGVQRDFQTMEQLEIVFGLKEGVTSLNMCGVVVRSSDQRSTSKTQYVNKSLVSLFDKDIHNVMSAFVTFSDSGVSQAEKILNSSGFFCKDIYKINNSSLLDVDSNNALAKPFMNMTRKSIIKLIDDISTSEDVHLDISRELMFEKRQLRKKLSSLLSQINLVFHKFVDLKNEEEILKKAGDDEEAFKNYEIEVDELVTVEKITSQANNVVCDQCKFVCCRRCNCGAWIKILQSAGTMIASYFPAFAAILAPLNLFLPTLDKCSSFPNGRCTKCPLECDETNHVIGKKIYVQQLTKTKKTAEAVFQKYQMATKMKSNKKDVIKNINRELMDMNLKLLNLLRKSKVSYNKINEKSRIPTEMGFEDYIIMLEAVNNIGHSNNTSIYESIKNKNVETLTESELYNIIKNLI